jgi:hypothetical protein
MATVTATTLTRAPVSEKSYDYSDQASITAAPGTGDIWQFLVIPAGTEIHSIRIQNATLGTGAPGDLGYLPVDGSTGDADAFLDNFKFEVPHAGTTDGTKALDSDTLVFERLLATPVRVEKDSFLAITFGTINTGASGACTIAINGKLLGPK